MKLSLPPQTLLLPSPVLIIGTYGSDGKPNIMAAAWGGVASSKPPCINISLREATLTYHNIKHTEAFTVNIPSEKYVKEADLCRHSIRTENTTNSRNPPYSRKSNCQRTNRKRIPLRPRMPPYQTGRAWVAYNVYWRGCWHGRRQRSSKC